MYPFSLAFYFFLFVGFLSLISAKPVNLATLHRSHDRHKHHRHHHYHHHRYSQSRPVGAHKRLQVEIHLLASELQDPTRDHQGSTAVKEPSPLELPRVRGLDDHVAQ